MRVRSKHQKIFKALFLFLSFLFPIIISCIKKNPTFYFLSNSTITDKYNKNKFNNYKNSTKNDDSIYLSTKIFKNDSIALKKRLYPVLKKLKEQTSASDCCWSRSYSRGSGTLINTCKKGLEQSGFLCYPPYDARFTGLGPVCWQNCPKSFRDDGAFCFTPDTYGRGAGYFISNLSKCEKENPEGCEQYGLLCYPKCRQGFSNFGCCLCSAVCPEGMGDIGISCAKKSYGRGAGTALTCAENEEFDVGFCYRKCDKGFIGVGKYCWKSCPQGYIKCGAVCLKNRKSCPTEIEKSVDKIVNLFVEYGVQNYVEGLKDMLEYSEEEMKVSACES